MLQKIKDNKLSIIIVTLIVAAVAVAVYYVNFVYIPAQKAARMDAIAAERAAEDAAQKAAEAATLKSETDEGYDYSIIIQNALAQEAERAEDNSFAPDSSVTVTTNPETGDVYIDREWGDTSGLNVTTPPTEETTNNTVAGNMASGTMADIAGEDGTYHGEPGSESAPTTNSDANTPSTGDDTSTSSNDSSQSGSTTETPSGSDSSSASDTPSSSNNSSNSNTSSNSGSSGSGVYYDQFPGNPKDGDICYIDGVEYMYINYIGWLPRGSGSSSIPFEGNGFIGVPCPNASFG